MKNPYVITLVALAVLSLFTGALLLGAGAAATPNPYTGEDPSAGLTTWGITLVTAGSVIALACVVLGAVSWQKRRQ